MRPDRWPWPRLLALCEPPTASAESLVARVREAVHAFAAGSEPADDVTLLAARRTTLRFGLGRLVAR